MKSLSPFLLALALGAAAPPAGADALDRLLSGVWGSPGFESLRCAGNAKHPSMAKPELLRFTYEDGIWFPPTTWTRTLDYRVLGRGETWLRLSIPNEYREWNGKPIIWRLEFTGPDRFHWLVDGDPAATPDNPQIRCPGIAPIS